MDTLNSIRWEIENNCNLRCKHCFIADDTKSSKLISYAEAIQIIDKLSALGIQNINFTTMEPLLFPDISKVIKYCSFKHIKTSIITNGTLLAESDFAKEIIQSGVDHISISLEGISDVSNDAIRGKGSFQLALKGIENCQANQRRGHYVSIGIQMSLNRYSVNEVEDIPEFFNHLNIDYLYIGNISISGNAKHCAQIKLSDDEYMAASESLVRAYQNLKEKRFTISQKSFLPYESIWSNIQYGTDFIPMAPNCSSLNHNYSLLPDGTLVPCIALLKLEKDMPSYSLFDANFSLTNYKNFQEKLREEIISYKDDTCKQCYFTMSCIACKSNLIQDKSTCSISSRCLKAKIKVDEFLENISKNSPKYIVELKDNVTLKKTDNDIELKKNYHIGSIVKKKKYTFNQTGIELMEDMFQHKELSLEYLSQKYFKDIQKTINFLIPLFLDNYLIFKEK